MDIVFLRKFRFFALFVLSIVLVTQAALVTTVYERFYTMMPHILPGYNATLFVAVSSLVLGVLGTVINIVDGVQKPVEAGVGKLVAMGAGASTIITMSSVFGSMSASWGLPAIFLLAAGGITIIGLVILFDDTEARRLEREAHTEGVAALHGGKKPT